MSDLHGRQVASVIHGFTSCLITGALIGIGRATGSGFRPAGSAVMITVGATILALFPLALEGGPFWKPLCYAQIGGLAVATFITLLLVPVFYSIFVLDLKWISWETTDKRQEITEAQPTTS
jgi:hypothetical protein